MKFKQYLTQRLNIIKNIHNLNISSMFDKITYLAEWKYILLTSQRFSNSKISIINNKLDIKFINTELNPTMVICISFILEKFCRDDNKNKLYSTRGYTGISHLVYCTYPFIKHFLNYGSELDLVSLARNYNK